MLIIVELLLFLGGLWALFKRRVPSWLLGRGKYQVVGGAAQRLGLIMILLLPVSIAVGALLGIFFGEEGIVYGFIFEFVFVVAAIILLSQLGKRLGQPITSDPLPEMATFSQH